MQAVIQKVLGSRGEHITLMGWGSTESIARQAAFERCNHGHNPYDEEWQGGELIESSDALDNELLSDDYNRITSAQGSLIIENGILSFKGA